MKTILILCGFTSLVMLGGSVTDRDGNTYPTTSFGQFEWMAENLRVLHFRNGDPIPLAADEQAWQQACQTGQPACIYYGLDVANGKKYGLLYNEYAIADPRGLAPAGWHPSTAAEWQAILQFLKATSSSNRSFKSSKELKSTSGWRQKNGKNTSGLSVIPAGTIQGEAPRFGGGDGSLACFYGGKMDAESQMPDIILMEASYHGVNIFSAQPNQGYSVRCVKDR